MVASFFVHPFSLVSLVCTNPQMQRNANGVEIPAGWLYLSFPVWTSDRLIQLQLQKFTAEAKAAELQAEKMAKLQTVQEATNLLDKLWKYRDALEATEKQVLIGASAYKMVPASVDDVVPLPTPTSLGSPLLVGKSGIIWRQPANGSSNNSNNRPQVLGEAHLKRVLPQMEAAPLNEEAALEQEITSMLP
jgi:hypothetical protein